MTLQTLEEKTLTNKFSIIFLSTSFSCSITNCLVFNSLWCHFKGAKG